MHVTNHEAGSCSWSISGWPGPVNTGKSFKYRQINGGAAFWRKYFRISTRESCPFLVYSLEYPQRAEGVTQWRVLA